MNVLCITLLIVLVSDQTLKLLLRRLMGSASLPLGPFGNVRIVEGRLWLRRLGAPSSAAAVWCFWIAAAVPLVLVSPLVPSSPAFAGLLLGGSLSHAIESSMRGSITDYICLRLWPPFDLADLALAAGAIGMIAHLLIAIHLKAS
jgi:signal peptidase II